MLINVSVLAVPCRGESLSALLALQVLDDKIEAMNAKKKLKKRTATQAKLAERTEKKANTTQVCKSCAFVLAVFGW